MVEEKEEIGEVSNISPDDSTEIEPKDQEDTSVAVAEELTEEEAQAKIIALVAEQAELEEVRLVAERKELDEARAIEQKEIEARQEEETKLREAQDRKLKFLTTQVKSLKNEGVDVSSLVDDISDGAMARVATYERRGASLANQIAYWLEVSTGKPHDGDDILILDVRADRVQYRFKGLENISSILRKPNEDLVDPPVHDHEYKVLVYGGQSACGCGKSNPES